MLLKNNLQKWETHVLLFKMISKKKIMGSFVKYKGYIFKTCLRKTLTQNLSLVVDGRRLNQKPEGSSVIDIGSISDILDTIQCQKNYIICD